MRYSLGKIQSKIKKNADRILLITLIIISIISTNIFNINNKKTIENHKNLINNVYFQKSLSYIFNKLEPKYIDIIHKIETNETFDKILNKYQIPTNEINKIKNSLKKENNLNNLKTNLTISFTIDQSENKKITKFTYPVSRTKKIQLIRDIKSDNFTTNEIITILNKKIIFKEGEILQSLYKTAIDLKIEPNIIIEFARLYGFEVDFQRDIRKNDNFQIIYEVFKDDNNKIHETGNILFANLQLREQNNPLYFFSKKNDEGHYDNNGKSIQKALMKTPINGARLSSKFGMRKHPIDGFNKMHRGTDFAAPKGTPIMASGSGTITRARWCGGGGNCIKIKHNSTYSTIYAHLSRFASGIKKGVRVKQGQTIGFVGSTGKSTGPHLHYEVLVKNKRINSQTLKLPSGKTLTGNSRKFFEVEKIKLNVLKAELILNEN